MDTKPCKGILCEGKELPLTEFSQKANICKKCTCHNIKEHYKKNGRKYRNYKNEIKQDSKCVECGCNDIRLLEFDHIDKKNINICKSFSKKAIENELNLVRVLCVWCHRLNTRKQLDKVKQNTDKMYTIMERPKTLEEGRICVGKICNGNVQFNSQFYTSVKSSICKVCNSYESRLKREININYINELKLSLKECELCKRVVTSSTTSCFDFDHLHNKAIGIAEFTRKNKDLRNEILEESKKCRLLCCNCHRIFTAQQRGFIYTLPKECVKSADTTPPS
jgi:hypothetical protein